ncbi:MAG: lipase family protein [Thiohalocapsa sp.]|jgi:pimeloyl-ACP methyl ester carboxylesterase|uniref:lipase family protein n=1 Tax=Thiohalocapsa sp. TaxID=2497641 RepID=UPI0025E26778|nr:lipase family protein [Thiohalocapsa sp.]MCG6943481.1 lipase family protein [Thiohalocapsa sp.]
MAANENFLAPSLAADIAKAVYEIQEESNVTDAFDLGGFKALNTAYDTGGAQVVSALSGLPVFGSSVGTSTEARARFAKPRWRPESGFGLVMQSSGADHLVVATRGTATFADWLSNANVGLARGPQGLLVHQGFHKIYEQFRRDLITTTAAYAPRVVHCVGHSLGGALASLAAVEIKGRIGCDVKLYTFGAPRVGLSPFCRTLTDDLLAGNIKRVWNPADPVPMVPLWPFAHGPMPGDGLMLPNTGLSLNPWKHKMSAYGTLVTKLDWEQVAASGHRDNVTGGVEQALAIAGDAVTLPGTGLWALSKALSLVLKLAAHIVQAGLTTAFTSLDMIARLLERAADLATQLGYYLQQLIGLVLRFLGRQAMSGVELTRAFLRYVLGLLFDAVAMAARRALHRPEL